MESISNNPTDKGVNLTPKRISSAEAAKLAQGTKLPNGEFITTSKGFKNLAHLVASEIGFPSGSEATSEQIAWWWNIEASHHELASEISPDLLPALNNIRASCGLAPIE